MPLMIYFFSEKTENIYHSKNNTHTHTHTHTQLREREGERGVPINFILALWHVPLRT